MNALSSTQPARVVARPLPGPRRLRRVAAAAAVTLALGWGVWNPLAELGAAAIVIAPNAGRAPQSVAQPGEMLVDVGPPAARLSVEIVDPRTTARGTVFLLHGIRDSKRSMRGWAMTLAARGYRTVLVNSRGHGRSSGDVLSFGVLESHDLSSVVDALAAKGRIAGEIGVLGHSYGAATALEWAGRDERVRAVVAVAPFASLRDVVPGYTPLPLPSFFTNRAIDLAGRLGGFDPDEASPVLGNAATRAAVLLVHGSDDQKIAVEQSRRISAAGRNHTTLIVVDGKGHDDVMGSREANLVERAPAWFDAHLH